MNIEIYFEKVKFFLENEPFSHKLMQHLKNNTEIGIVIEGLDCTYFSKNKTPKVEKRKAQNPSIIFILTPEAVDILSQIKNKSIGGFGIEILKQYLAGGLKCASFISYALLRRKK